MKTTMQFHRVLATWQVIAALSLAGGAAFAAPTFASYNTDSDILGVAHETDTECVNPWGLAIGEDGNLHVSDDATGKSSVYMPDGTILSGGTTAIDIPSVTGTATGSPTGVVENDAAFILRSDTSDFDVTSGTTTKPAHFLYGTQDGEIVGYRIGLDATSGVVEYTSTNGAGYTGVALSWVTGTDGNLHHVLYAADFANGSIDTFDAKFKPITLGTSAFVTPVADVVPVPGTAPAGAVWSPFNIKSVDVLGPEPVTKRLGVLRRVLVAYALSSGTSAPLNDVEGAGYGYIDAFDEAGKWLGRVATAGSNISSPWGMAVTRHGVLAGFSAPVVLFVGNHYDGIIHAFAFDVVHGTGSEIGTLPKDHAGTPLGFDGLWGLHFGPVTVSQIDYELNHAVLDEDFHTLFFTAGILQESRGLVGQILFP